MNKSTWDVKKMRINKDIDINIADWLPVIVLLMIPGVRIIGIFLLLKKAKTLFRFTRNLRTVHIICLVILIAWLAELVSKTLWVTLPVTAIVLAAISLGLFKNRRDERFDDYLSCIGDNDNYNLTQLAYEMGVDEQKLKKDLRKMKKQGILPKSAYIDEGHNVIVMRAEGKVHTAPVDAQKAAEPEKPLTENERILREIRALNVAIDDEDVSKKIDRIEELTANIFHLVEQRPERKNDIQTFMEYYLPSTLKLLRHYARLEQQSVAGENISESRARIEGILNKLVAGYEKQLDMLFRSDAIDITSDVKVLEKMMQMDGLTQKNEF